MRQAVKSHMMNTSIDNLYESLGMTRNENQLASMLGYLYCTSGDVNPYVGISPREHARLAYFLNPCTVPSSSSSTNSV